MLPDSIFNKPGWCEKNKAERLFRLVIDSDASTTLELQTIGDISFIAMALAHQYADLGSVIKLDPYDKPLQFPIYDKDDPNYKWWFDLNKEGLYNTFINSINEYDLHDNIEHYYYKNDDAVELFEENSIDIVHGSATCEDVELYHSKIKEGGYFVLNDCEWGCTIPVEKCIISKGFTLYENYYSWKIFVKNIQ